MLLISDVLQPLMPQQSGTNHFILSLAQNLDIISTLCAIIRKNLLLII